jgi:hypothetical protein
MTLNSVEIAITSAPSVAESGLRGMSIASSTIADQPVASTIGISGTRARRAERYTATSTTPIASRPARVSQ